MFQRDNFAIMCINFYSKVKICLIYLVRTLICHLCCRQKGRFVEPWSGQISPAPGWGDAPPQDFLSCTWLEIESWFLRGCHFSPFKVSRTFQVAVTFGSRDMTLLSRPCQGTIRAISSFRSETTTFSRLVMSCGVSRHRWWPMICLHRWWRHLRMS